MSPRRSESTGRSPDFAAILTWFVPGAGHLYLGRPLAAVLAFVLVEGLYLLGIHLSGGRLFEFLEPDLQGPLAGGLSPEVGNLGALVWHMKTYAFGPGYPRPWPEHIHLGSWLTASSGMLNACLMMQAHLLARVPRDRERACTRVGWQVLAGWIVPGLGHVLQRRFGRGLAVFGLLVGLFAIGTLLADGSNLDRERHFYYWGGQFLVGAPAAILEALHAHARITRELPYVDAGLVLGCLAGLLNVLALLDVFTRAETAVVPAGAGRTDATEARVSA